MNKIVYYILCGFFISVVLSSCVTAKFHDYADFDIELATQYIQQLKEDTIVIALSTYKEQENIYKRAIKYGSRDVNKNKERLSNLDIRRKAEIMSMIEAFEENFSFAKVLYMPDSLVHSFERGEERDFFINTRGELDSTIRYSNRSPIKILQQGGTQWTIVHGNKILPNPFPNNYAYKNGLAIFLGLASHKKISKDVATKLQLRFSKYYANPNSRVYL